MLSAPEIVRKTGLNRGTVYHALQSLVRKKGLVRITLKKSGRSLYSSKITPIPDCIKKVTILYRDSLDKKSFAKKLILTFLDQQAARHEDSLGEPYHPIWYFHRYLNCSRRTLFDAMRELVAEGAAVTFEERMKGVIPSRPRKTLYGSAKIPSLPAEEIRQKYELGLKILIQQVRSLGLIKNG